MAATAGGALAIIRVSYFRPEFQAWCGAETGHADEQQARQPGYLGAVPYAQNA